MTAYNIPSIDPANNDSLVGTISFAFSKMMQNVNGMLPAQVIEYDRETNRVQVQILITMLSTSGDQMPRPVVGSVPVIIMGGGGFSLSFPINDGDLGWIMAADRDISLFLQSYAQSPPNSNRVKNFADGLFIPDAMKTYNYTTPAKGYFVLQSNDGSSSILMGKNPTSGLNEININADVINLIPNNPATGYVNVYGNLAVAGPVGITVPPVPPVPYPPG